MRTNAVIYTENTLHIIFICSCLLCVVGCCPSLWILHSRGRRLVLAWGVFLLSDGDDRRTVRRGEAGLPRRRHLRALGVHPVLLHHHAVAALLGDVVDVEVPVSAGE